jgi:hypothetical protein
MITISNVLTEIARVIGITQPGANDSEFLIQPTVLLVIPPLTPIDKFNVGAVGDIQRQSFAGSIAATVSAGGGAFGANVAQVGKGLWRFNVMGSFSSNHGPSAAFAEFALIITNGTGSLYLLHFNVCGTATQPTVQNQTRTVEVALATDSILSATLSNNAAGQTDTGTFSLTAQKLL